MVEMHRYRFVNFGRKTSEQSTATMIDQHLYIMFSPSIKIRHVLRVLSKKNIQDKQYVS
jgi:hypothetical protein